MVRPFETENSMFLRAFATALLASLLAACATPGGGTNGGGLALRVQELAGAGHGRIMDVDRAETCRHGARGQVRAANAAV